jgi:crossover junction endodeoxyribonuclease RuvC
VIILGIDPGTAALGYGIVERNGSLRAVDHGCLVTSPDRPLPDRLAAIHALVEELIELHRPDVVAVERVFFSRNVQTALAVGHARGVVLLAAAQAGVPVREATPSEVKAAVAGHGDADKEQVARMVKLVLGMAELPRPDDAADALAIAIWAAHRVRSGDREDAAVLDRAAVAPLARGESAYERAVKEALAREGAGRTRGRPTGRPSTRR